MIFISPDKSIDEMRMENQSDLDFLVGLFINIFTKLPQDKSILYISSDKKEIEGKCAISYYFNEEDYKLHFIRRHADFEIYRGPYMSETFKGDIKHFTNNDRIYKDAMYITLYETDDFFSGIAYPLTCLMLRFNDKGMITVIKRTNTEIMGNRPLMDYAQSRAFAKDELAQIILTGIQNMIARMHNRYKYIVKNDDHIFHVRYKYKE
jgi:hypothetical protein